jgi:hypothetical protein
MPGSVWREVHVDDWIETVGTVEDEPLGTKDKVWVTDPTGGRWLFKAARTKGDRVLGEDWAEWLVCRLGRLIGVPTAVVEPALREGQRGIVSRSMLAEGHRLAHGNELLARVDPLFNPELLRRNDRYTVDAVLSALDGVGPPVAWPALTGQTAFEVWAGYLLMDAWVAGRDRHPRNWAVDEHLLERNLAPSFDHGNALGFQESIDEHQRLSEDPQALDQWTRRGKSPHFAGAPRLTALARDAARLSSSEAAGYWTERLDSLEQSAVDALVESVPDRIMSEPTRSFCRELLRLNRRRVLDDD